MRLFSRISHAAALSRFPRSLCLTSCLLLALGAWAGASPKHHKNPGSAKAHVHAAHLARLAAQEKAAWRAHLAKERALPHAKRVAEKRHDRHFKRLADRQHLARLAQQKAHAARLAKLQAHTSHLAKLTQSKSMHREWLAAHQAKMQHMTQLAAAHRAHVAAAHPSARQNKTLAAHLARANKTAAIHVARVNKTAMLHAAHARAHQIAAASHRSAHDVRLAQVQAKHLQNLRAHQQAIAQRALAHQTHLARAQSLHAAHAAALRARRVALHGDDSGGRSIHFWQTVAAGVPVKVITVDLNDQDVKVSAVMSRRGSGTAEPFRQMIDRANPNVAVTGTFFSLDNLQPVGDIVIDGSLVHFGGMGTALCITPTNRADMVTCEWGRHHNWSGYDFVCACGPRLLRNGQVVLDPRAERFRDRHMLAPNSRIAVGITRGNKIVFAMTHEPIYLGRLAKVMRAIGTTEAMNLDAGTSTGFYYNGATLARPGRQLTNMIVVYGQKQRYQRALDQLVPASYRRSSLHASARGQVSALVHP